MRQNEGVFFLPKLKQICQSIFTRIILIFFLAMLPIYGVGIEIYNWGITAIRGELISNRIVQMNFHTTTLDKELSNVMELQSDCINSDEANWLSNAYPFISDYQRGKSMIALRRQLDAIKSSSYYIEDATLYFPELDKKISASFGTNPMTSKDMELLASKTTMGTEALYHHEQLYTHSTVMVKNKLLYALVVNFSSKKLDDSLLQFNYDANEGITFFMDTDIVQPALNITFEEDEKKVCESLLSAQKKFAVSDKEKKKQQFSGSETITIDKKDWLVIYAGNSEFPFTICSAVKYKTLFSPVEQYESRLWFFCSITAIIIVGFSFSIYRLMQQPLKKLVDAFRKVDGGDLDFTIEKKGNDEFGYLYKHFNYMLSNLRHWIDQSYKQRIMVQQAELKQLQAQINPHFLYNSYFFLHRVIKQHDEEKALIISKDMGTYFQYITRNSHEKVPLKHEVEHARIYCNIQTMRFEERIFVEFGAFLPEYADREVPRLILQPIIENCFVHGLREKEEEGILRIQFKPDLPANELLISIEDNGEQTTQEEILQLISRLDDPDCETTGVINIHRRLQIMFGGRGGLRILRSELGGIKIVIVLPLS